MIFQAKRILPYLKKSHTHTQFYYIFGIKSDNYVVILVIIIIILETALWSWGAAGRGAVTEFV